MRALRHITHTVRIAAGALLVLLLAVGCTETPDASGVSAETLRRRPVDPQTASYLAGAQQALGQDAYGAALALVDSAAARAPGLPDVHFLRGRVFTELSRPAQAEAAYRQAVALDPLFRGAWFNLGNTLFRRQQYREALASYRKEQAAHPAPAVLLAMGRVYEKLSEVDSARAAYGAAVAAAPRAPTAHAAHARLSRLLEEDGQPEAALGHARQALALAPQDVNYRYLTASLLLQVGQAEAAASALEAVLAEDPYHYGAHYNLGQALVRLGRHREAQPYLALADSVQRLQSEVEHRRALAKMNPQDLKPWLDLADALRRVRRYDEAVDAYEQALYLRPADRALHANLATLYLEAGDAARAVQRYRAVLAQHPMFTEAWLNLGVIYASAGRWAEAEQAWRQVLAYDPDNHAATAYLERLAAE